jgi:hypothetical protein
MGIWEDEVLISKRWLFLFAFLFLTSVFAVEQSFGYFKNGQSARLIQTCDNCTYVNISYITYPNNTMMYSTDQVMTKSGLIYYFDIPDTNLAEFGRYVVCGYGDEGGTTKTWCADFTINTTGRPEPEGIVLVLFLVVFIILLGGLTYMFIFSLGHAIKQDFDMVDLAFDWGIYFAVIAFYAFQNEYLGSPIMFSILDMLIYVGAFTHMFLPLLFLFLSIVHANTVKQQSFQGGNE